MIDIQARLRSAPLFRELRDRDLQDVVELGRVEHWPAAAVLIEQDTVSPRLVVLLDGEAVVSMRTSSGTKHDLTIVGPGAVLGEIGMLRQSPASASVIARTELTLWAMDRERFDELVTDHDPLAMRIALGIARTLAARLLETNRRVVALLARDGREESSHEFAKLRGRMESWWDIS